MAQQAQDTFVADLKDGTPIRVTRGEVFPDDHELVKRDQAGSGTLFAPLDLGEAETPAPRARVARGQGKGSVVAAAEASGAASPPSKGGG